jgi:hypothetical protein
MHCGKGAACCARVLPCCIGPMASRLFHVHHRRLAVRSSVDVRASGCTTGRCSHQTRNSLDIAILHLHLKLHGEILHQFYAQVFSFDTPSGSQSIRLNLILSLLSLLWTSYFCFVSRETRCMRQIPGEPISPLIPVKRRED